MTTGGRRRPNRPPTARPPIAQGPMVGGRRVAAPRQWRWRTFPVFCTFAATLFLTTLANLALSPSRGGAVLLILSCLPLAVVLAHLVAVALVGPRIRPQADVPSGHRSDVP